MREVVDWKNTVGARLYAKAKLRIPGGTQLLSKRPEMFLPDQWPAYYSKAKGCEVWDLEDRHFFDFASMGIGSCLLGYADDDVDQAVKQCIDRGSMCTLNPPEEPELAELILAIHPWASKVRYARTGGESMAIVVRIARAFTGRSKVAICGYHGWSDWYLAANLASEAALEGHLLPGLEPRGVPRPLEGTALTFRYNQIDQLEALVAAHGSDLAAIVMEPKRYQAPAPGFLERVRQIADQAGAVLVFDEITAAWRDHYGGIHLTLGVEPDLAVFGKATSNGYPMAAIIGRDQVMQAAQTSFISSTFWTERIGPVAALATIGKMGRLDLPAHTHRVGQQVQEGWRRSAARHKLNLNIHGSNALSFCGFEYGEQAHAVRTLFTQEMLDRGFLAGTSVYASLPHTPALVEQYLAAVDDSFKVLKDALEHNDLESRLGGPVAHSGFARLT